MKKILFTLLTLIGINATAQVKVGTNHTILATNANFQVEGTTTADQFIVLKNGNVGIGTTAPANKLDVNGGLRVKHITGSTLETVSWPAQVDGTFFSLVLTGDGSDNRKAPLQRFQSSTASQFIDIGLRGTNNDFVIERLSGNILTATQTGNVGIGTTVPETTLHINTASQVGNTLGSLVRLARFQSNVNNISFLDISSRRHTAGGDWTGTSLRIQRQVDNTAMGFIDFGVDNLLSSGGIGLGTGITTHMMVDVSGRIGIGTITPSHRLHVVGDAKVSALAGTGSRMVVADATGVLSTQSIPTGNAGTVTSVTGSAPLSVATGTTTPVISIATANTSTTGALTGADWTTFNNKIGTATNGLTASAGNVKLGGALIENTSLTGDFNFTIPGTGNVGIGTTTPISKLSVVGTNPIITIADAAGTAGGIHFGNSSHGVKRNYNGVTNDVGLYTVGNIHLSGLGETNSHLTVTVLGNVGIGTTTPSTKLEVAGQVKITGGAPGAGKVLTSDATGLASWTTPAASGVTSVTGTAPLSVATGTTTPVISIATANTSTTGALTGADWTTFNNKIGTATNGLTASAGNVKLGGALIENTSLTGNFNFTIPGTGNVGIGTTTPTEKLNVTGAIRTSSSSTSWTTGDAGLTMDYIPGTNGVGRLHVGDGTTIGNRDLSITAKNVGIGTTTPTNKLHVVQSVFNPSTNDLASIKVEGSWGGGIVFAEGTNRTFISSPGGDNLAFGTGGTSSGTPERLRISPTGNVGIGTGAPTAKLDVVGNMKLLTTPTITTATKVLVKDPATSIISEQVVTGTQVDTVSIAATPFQVVIGNTLHNTASTGVILTSPNGSKWLLTVNNDGSFKSTAVTP